MAGRTKTRRQRAARPRRTPSGGKTHAPVTVRHYCQGIGDCHLLTFTHDDGTPFRMLIDCGVHSAVTGGNKKIDEVVDDIANVTDKIDVLVVTHEHWDHISGFFTAAEAFKKKLKVGAVWMGWTENPADPQAAQLDKFKGAALAALDKTRTALDAAADRKNGAERLTWHLSAMQDGLRGILGFHGFGAKGERVRSAREAVKDLAPPGSEQYLEPGDAPVVLPGLSNLRIYVLGPPRDAAMLGIRERASEMYGLGGLAGWPMASALASAFKASESENSSGEDWAAPFDVNVGANLARHLSGRSGAKLAADEEEIAKFVRTYYSSSVPEGRSPKSSRLVAQIKNQGWRRIDDDWLGMGADLAIQLDDRTNNSSLVLAFEFVDTGRVLLFTGDAQVGSWLSWQEKKWTVGDKTVSASDLLARTVYYKVGHHGSHNATLKQKGLEKMTHGDFAAFIPTNQKDAKKVKWGQMPFKKILDELDRRCKGRVIRADDRWLRAAAGKPSFKPSGCIKRVDHKPDLWVELDIA